MTELLVEVPVSHILHEEPNSLLRQLLRGPSLAIWPDRIGGATWLPPDALLGDLRAELIRLPFADLSFASVLCEIPQRLPRHKQEEVLSELSRVARRRIITAGPYLPLDGRGRYLMHTAFSMRQCFLKQSLSSEGSLTLFAIFEF
ncbi:MAG: hypothetical protein DWQ07_09220 [Chloroflexi bacterium]|nr:MAG: hypothetical protein DWQ07_09220 [Chloroflexota bacterium]MBL1193107.1 hypothetical protein [Chloroflexota bacterium]NOH10400.1 hypothetical protein [Chloroflexota bacterium]